MYDYSTYTRENDETTNLAVSEKNDDVFMDKPDCFYIEHSQKNITLTQSNRWLDDYGWL